MCGGEVQTQTDNGIRLLRGSFFRRNGHVRVTSVW
jgi:hypothetical protein